VLVLPTMPDVAPLLTESEEALDGYRNTALNLLSLSGLSGLPQVTLPLASRLGAPLGLSLIGPSGSDASLVRIAARLASEAAG
jgi:amidase